MAVMIPTSPNGFDERSHEGDMFEALKQLPDDYYVFHSFKILKTANNKFKEREMDFVVFNQEKGLMVIEAKANSKISYRDGRWYYNDMIPMSHDGPYRQADSSKWELKRQIEDKLGYDICQRCKFLHAVWFPLASRKQIQRLKFPADASSDITLGEEELKDPEPFIDSIYSHEVSSVTTDISDDEKEKLFDEVLCPYCEIVEGYGTGRRRKDRVFHRMLEEQKDLLDYLAFQKTAAIQGIGGTGKTLLALEKAKRLASQGRNILFLCYNKKLRDNLEENFNFRKSQVKFFTLDSFAYEITGGVFPTDYEIMGSCLKEELNYDGPDRFDSYTDIIIDEGQDFGKAEIENAGILQTLHDIITAPEINGSFYIFYDKLQFVQGVQIPKIIEDSDCKITLYKNCRNTKNIAETSMMPLNCETPEVNSPVVGDKPAFWFCEDVKMTVLYLAAAVIYLKEAGYEDIMILTCSTEEQSIIAPLIKRKNFEMSGFKIPFTTCRKFKGLEAEAVIMVDINREVLDGDKGNLFYVGASRAKFELCAIVNMSIEEQRRFLKWKFKINASGDDITKLLEQHYNADVDIWNKVEAFVDLAKKKMSN